jgi:uncharacterized protein (TIGR02246 family)
MKYDEAYKRSDAVALAALFTEDAVLVTPEGPFSGRQAVEKWYADLFERWHATNNIGQTDQLNAIDNGAWAIGKWWRTFQARTVRCLPGATGQRSMFVRLMTGRSAWPTSIDR